MIDSQLIKTYWQQTTMRLNSSDKPKVIYRRGLWSPEEDDKLRKYIFQYGHGCWSSLSVRAGLQRNGKSCRLRWLNYLKPGLKRGVFTAHEDDTILALRQSLGNKWSQIAQQLPGRTDNEIKNYWHSCLKKKFQAQNNIQSSKTTESASNSKESNSEISSLESIQTCFDTNKYVPKFLSHDSSGATNSTCLPKILFSEWLVSDDCQYKDSVYSGNQMVTMANSNDSSVLNVASLSDYLSHESTVTNTSSEHYFPNREDLFVDILQHDWNNSTSYAKFEQVDFVDMAEMYNDFNMYHESNYK